MFVSRPKGTRFLTPSGLRHLRAVALRRRLRLDRFADPSTQPPGAFPRRLVRGLPPRRASARSTSTPQLIRCNTAPLFRSLRLSAQKLCESQAAKPQQKPKPCPSRRRDRHPVLDGLAPSAFLRGIERNGQFPFFVPPAEILPPRFKVCCSSSCPKGTRFPLPFGASPSPRCRATSFVAHCDPP